MRARNSGSVSGSREGRRSSGHGAACINRARQTGCVVAAVAAGNRGTAVGQLQVGFTASQLGWPT